MKIDIHYYTGTGNTARAVAVMEKALKAKKHTVSVTRITDALSPTAPNDSAVIAFPVYAWMPPVTMQRYLARFPNGSGHIALIAIRGGMPGPDVGGYTGGALAIAKHMLERRGYTVTLTADAGYPDNWTQFIPPLTGKDITATCAKGDAEVTAFIQKFISGKSSLYHPSVMGNVITGIIAKLFLIIGRKALGTAFIADENCNSCGLCAKHCPTHTIRMTGKPARPFWRFTCECCNRCINICPKRSIQMSLSFLIIGSVLTAIMIIAGILPFGSIERSLAMIPMPGIIAIKTAYIVLVIVLAHVAAFALFYRLCFALTGIRPVRRFFAKSYTQRYGRYTAPGFKAK